MRLRLIPRAQDALCADCEAPLRERWRRPCPRCGSMARLIVRSLRFEPRSEDRFSS